MAKKVLSWVIHARRTLSTAKVQHALAVEPKKMVLNGDFILEVEMLGSVCAGLATVNAESNIIRLVHYTA